MEDIYYKVTIKCKNCGVKKFSLQIVKGSPVHVWKCPNCQVAALKKINFITFIFA